MFLFSHKLVFEIDIDSFSLLTLFPVSVILVHLDLSNDLALSDLLLLYLSTVLLDDCGFSILLTVSIFFLAMGVVMDSFTALVFVPVSLSLPMTTFLVVVTNDFSEDMVTVLDLLYPVNYKIKV